MQDRALSRNKKTARLSESDSGPLPSMEKSLMKKSLALSVLAVCGALSAVAYQPLTNRITTVWGEKMTPATAWTEYPRPNLVREKWQNLNGLWQYAVVPRADACPTNWDGEILVPFCLESALSGVGRLLKPDEQLWYRRTFTAAFEAPEERLLLHFGAVDQRTQVFVNGVEATDVPHEGGNLPFTLDITDLAHPGSNEL